jgi:ATP-dependent Lhr-like helicase
MSGRELLARQDPPFDPRAVSIDDAEVLDRLEPAVREWWVDQFGEYVPDNGGFFTPPQKEAIPHIDERRNVLVASPTGSGKTQASFLSIINDLYRREREERLENSVYCLYVSPLKSLANDIHRNVAVPLDGIAERADGDVDIRHAIRHGDTPDSERQRMLTETPHILNTTPETLAILLNSPKFKRKLETVEYVIVDEIHALAANKRGTHLSVSLERLEAMCEGSPTRVGCSATVEPLETMAQFLVGQDGGSFREYEIVDTRFLRRSDLELVAPAADLINTPAGEINDRFYRRLHSLIQDHTNTIVFTNTRSGAERVLQNLRERFDGYPEERSGCHHGSLSTEKRRRVEEGLKEGSMDVVTTSTSLELGIDMPHVDLVVQVGSPKSVAALLQRVGRAGHQLGATVTGRVFALDRDELVECAVMLRKATEGFVDRVFVPEGAHDVAAQQVYGMAINGPRPEAEIRRILRRAYPFRGYGDEDWETLLRYLTADYDGLEQRNVYPKVWRDTNDPPGGEHHYPDYEPGEPLVGKRGRMARVIYMTNIGTIPDSFTCDVFTRSGEEWVGQLDEEYLDTLETGDVFVLGGSNYEFRYRRGSKVYVDPTAARPTVPSWFSERLPLSYDLGREILAFQRELLDRLDDGGPAAVRSWLREFPLDDDAVRALARLFDEQVRYAGRESVSTDGRLAVEEELDRGAYERHYYVHSNYGRRFNDGLSRLLAYRVAQAANANVQVAVADNGFTLSMPLNRKVDLVGVLEGIDPAEVRADLRASLNGTDLLKRYFRINATRSLMILKRYKGYEKSAAEQQVSSEMLLSFAESLEGFAVVEETYREILEDKLNVAAIEEVLRAVQAGELTVRSWQVDSPSPRAFGLATLMASDVVLAEDESAVLREFHERVMQAIGDEEGDGESDDDRAVATD